MTFLKEEQLMGCVDVLLLSSHGVAPSTCGDSLYLESFIKDISKTARVVSGAVGRLEALPGRGEDGGGNATGILPIGDCVCCD